MNSQPYDGGYNATQQQQQPYYDSTPIPVVRENEAPQVHHDHLPDGGGQPGLEPYYHPQQQQYLQPGEKYEQTPYSATDPNPSASPYPESTAVGDGYGGASTVPPEKKKILGMKKNIFWLLVGLGVAIVVIAILAGLLAGLLPKQNESSADSSPTETYPPQVSDATTVPTTSPTRSPTSTTSATATTTGGSTIPTLSNVDLDQACPSRDGDTFRDGESSKDYTVRCGEFSGGSDAEVIKNLANVGFATCVLECLQGDKANECKGVTYQAGNSTNCWLVNEWKGLVSNGQDINSAEVVKA